MIDFIKSISHIQTKHIKKPEKACNFAPFAFHDQVTSFFWKKNIEKWPQKEIKLTKKKKDYIILVNLQEALIFKM